MNKTVSINFIVIVVASASLFGCSSETLEAKKLGFANVEEMKEIHANGWHTKARYEEDTAAAEGFKTVADWKSAEEMRKAEAGIAADKKRKEDEELRMARAKAEKERFQKDDENKKASRIAAEKVTAERPQNKITYQAIFVCTDDYGAQRDEGVADVLLKAAADTGNSHIYSAMITSSAIAKLCVHLGRETDRPDWDSVSRPLFGRFERDGRDYMLFKINKTTTIGIVGSSVQTF